MERQFNDTKEIINQQRTQLNPAQIIITVEEPILCQKDAFNYFTYNIFGKDQNGPFAIRRRYSDFDLLRKKLTQNWLGIYLPPINGKRSESSHLFFLKMFQSKSNETKYVQFRRKFLQYFCEGIASRPYLYFCELFQIFIRGGPIFEQAIRSFSIKEYRSILTVYQSNFNKIMEQGQRDVFAYHLVGLKKSESTLVDICQKIYRVIEARELFNLQFNFSTQKVIPQYQQKFLLNHVNRNRQKLVFNKCENLNQKLMSFEKMNEINPLEVLLEMVMYQIREVKSFIQTIQGRKQAEKRRINLLSDIQDIQNLKAKIQKGSFSFRALFMSGSKEAQINELTSKIKYLRNQYDSIGQMIEIMVITTNFQLDQFRQRRGLQYKETLKHFAKQELFQVQALQQIINMTLSSIPLK